MTISTTDRLAGPFAGDDITVAFPFVFKVTDEDHLLVVMFGTVTEVESTLVLTTNYTVALNADQENSPGGTVTLLVALATDFELRITTDTPDVQPANLQNQGAFFPNVIEAAFDKLTILVQQVLVTLTRCLKFPLSNPSDSGAPLSKVDTVIGWDDSTPPELVNYTAEEFWGTIAGTDLVAVSVDDFTPGFLEAKIAAGTNVVLATLNPGANEQLEISVPTATPSSATPLVESGAGAVGVATEYSREDHVHPLSPVTPVGSATPLVESGAGSAGASANVSREDHVHPDKGAAPVGSATPLVESGAGAAGASANASREDHVHPLSPVTPLGSATPLVESGAGAAGASANASREDHVHPADPNAAPAVSGLKGASLVLSGNGTLGGGTTNDYLIEANISGARFYWVAVWHNDGTTATGQKTSHQIVTDRGTANTTNFTLRITVEAGSNPVTYWKVYRIDES